MSELLRGAIYGLSFFVVCLAAWNAHVLGLWVAGGIASHFPSTRIFLLPLCYLIPLLMLSATIYLIIDDMTRKKR